MHNSNIFGDGSSVSYYLDKRNKNKLNRSERVDLEFYGNYGAEDESSIINEYIKKYRNFKGWFR